MSNKFFTLEDNPEGRSTRVRYVRDRLLGISRDAFCENSEISHPTLKAWELGWGGGLTEYGAKKFVARAEQLGIFCTVGWLMHAIGNSATYQEDLSHLSKADEEHIAREILLFRELPHSVDERILDDAMQPAYPLHAYVGGIKVEKMEQAIGEPCILEDLRQVRYVRRLQAGDEPGKYTLAVLNPQTQQAKEIKNIALRWAAPIIWVRRHVPIATVTPSLRAP